MIQSHMDWKLYWLKSKVIWTSKWTPIRILYTVDCQIMMFLLDWDINEHYDWKGRMVKESRNYNLHIWLFRQKKKNWGLHMETLYSIHFQFDIKMLNQRHFNFVIKKIIKRLFYLPLSPFKSIKFIFIVETICIEHVLYWFWHFIFRRNTSR